MKYTSGLSVLFVLIMSVCTPTEIDSEFRVRFCAQYCSEAVDGVNGKHGYLICRSRQITVEHMVSWIISLQPDKAVSQLLPPFQAGTQNSSSEV